jgi:hypothetical protein
MADNDNSPDTFQCDGCGHSFPLSIPHFLYSDDVIACRDCSPTYEEAERGFREQAFDEPDLWREFCQRRDNHLRSGGALQDKYFNAP